MKLALQWHCRSIYSMVAQRNNALVVLYLPKLNRFSPLSCHALEMEQEQIQFLSS